MDLSHHIENGRTFIRTASLEKLEMASLVIGLLPLGLYDQLLLLRIPRPFPHLVSSSVPPTAHKMENTKDD